MCIIAIKPKGRAMFKNSEIRTMFQNNPDGAGLCYAENGRVIIEKGFMTVNSLLHYLGEKNFYHHNVILHFRIGTSGKKDALNCHPFPVYSKNAVKTSCDMALAHNGVFRDYTPPLMSKENDTQVFLKQVVSTLDPSFVKDDDKMFLLGELAGSSRLALMDKDGEYYLVGDFIESNGYLYSNWSFNPFKGYYAFKNLLDFEDEKEELKEMFEDSEALERRLDSLTCIDEGYYYDDDFYYTVDENHLTLYKEKAS